MYLINARSQHKLFRIQFFIIWKLNKSRMGLECMTVSIWRVGPSLRLAVMLILVAGTLVTVGACCAELCAGCASGAA